MSIVGLRSATGYGSLSLSFVQAHKISIKFAWTLNTQGPALAWARTYAAQPHRIHGQENRTGSINHSLYQIAAPQVQPLFYEQDSSLLIESKHHNKGVICSQKLTTEVITIMCKRSFVEIIKCFTKRYQKIQQSPAIPKILF